MLENFHYTIRNISYCIHSSFRYFVESVMTISCVVIIIFQLNSVPIMHALVTPFRLIYSSASIIALLFVLAFCSRKVEFIANNSWPLLGGNLSMQLNQIEQNLRFSEASKGTRPLLNSFSRTRASKALDSDAVRTIGKCLSNTFA